MNYRHIRLALVFFLTTVGFSSIADVSDGSDENAGTALVAKYLLHLGGFLGYDLTGDPNDSKTPALPKPLISSEKTQNIELDLFNSVLGAIPVNAAVKSFLPSTQPLYLINALANMTFQGNLSMKYPAYNTAQDNYITVSPLIDQQTFQEDPVSQSVLNILTTPDASYCFTDSAQTQWDSKCDLLYNSKIAVNVIGDLPSTRDFYTYKKNQALVGQLNSNTLLAPLLYSTETIPPPTPPTPPTGSPTATYSNTSDDPKGLIGKSQAEQAANFIRYATASVAPLQFPSLSNYDSVYNVAANLDGKSTDIQIQKAQASLAGYLNEVRVYAAQMSVSFSNLYYILSKRMPQITPNNTDKTPTSQALSEFNMATWRLVRLNKKDDSPVWMQKINDASSATIQKEMAVLLAEINYQLYLNRQQEERLLLTNTMLLIQNARSGQPDASALAPDTTGDSDATNAGDIPAS